MFEKNKMKKLLIAALLFAGACSFAPAPETGLTTDSISIDTSPATQAEYKKQWIGAVTNKVFAADANIWGTGAFGMQDFAFDAEGNLHNQTRQWPTWHPTHRIIAFKSGTQAVVHFYKTASITLYNSIYALEIRGDAIYRTENIGTASSGNKGNLGFSTIDKWDGVSYSSEKIVLLAPIDRSIAYPTLKVPDPNS